MRRFLSNVDFSVLVDIISNVAGMMILLACLALIFRQEAGPGQKAEELAKPISFPLAYIPDKRSVTICLKDGKLYDLPEDTLLHKISEEVQSGEPIEYIELADQGVQARLQLAPTATGYRFLFKLQPDGGIPLSDPSQITKTLRDLLAKYPSDTFFYVIHSWPDEMENYREIREFLHEEGVEVGWMPRSRDDRGSYDIVYSIGEYDPNLTSIKAQ